jgi:hypothetical protein
MGLKNYPSKRIQQILRDEPKLTDVIVAALEEHKDDEVAPHPSKQEYGLIGALFGDTPEK